MGTSKTKDNLIRAIRALAPSVWRSQRSRFKKRELVEPLLWQLCFSLLLWQVFFATSSLPGRSTNGEWGFFQPEGERDAKPNGFHWIFKYSNIQIFKILKYSKYSNIPLNIQRTTFGSTMDKERKMRLESKSIKVIFINSCNSSYIANANAVNCHP